MAPACNTITTPMNPDSPLLETLRRWLQPQRRHLRAAVLAEASSTTRATTVRTIDKSAHARDRRTDAAVGRPRAGEGAYVGGRWVRTVRTDAGAAVGRPRADDGAYEGGRWVRTDTDAAVGQQRADDGMTRAGGGYEPACGRERPSRRTRADAAVRHYPWAKRLGAAARLHVHHLTPTPPSNRMLTATVSPPFCTHPVAHGRRVRAPPPRPPASPRGAPSLPRFGYRRVGVRVS